MILAAERGRIGERYLISEKMISNAEVVRIAAEAAGVPAPTRTIPLPVAYAMAALGSAKARLRGTDERLNLNALRLMRAEAPVDHSKARARTRVAATPVEESIAAAARFWVGSAGGQAPLRSVGGADAQDHGHGALDIAHGRRFDAAQPLDKAGPSHRPHSATDGDTVGVDAFRPG